MIWTTEQLTEEFNAKFLGQVDRLVEQSGIKPGQWRAGGRRSKAYPNKEDASWWAEHGPGMVSAYAEWREKMEAVGWVLWTAPGGIPAIELELLVMFGATPVKMGLDRVFVNVNSGETAVVDLKTGSRDPDSRLQLGFYACGLELAFGFRPSYGSYYMARKAELTDLLPLDQYTIPQLTSELDLFNRAIDNEIFIPNRGSHCTNCGVARACSAVGGTDAAVFDPLHPDYGKVTA